MHLIKIIQNFKLLILIGFCSLISNTGQAQLTASTPSPFWSKVRYGGGIGLGFGDGFFSGTLAPSAIYEFNQKVAFGIGLNGTYNSEKNVYSSTVLGGSVMTLFNVIPEIQVSAEFEQLNVNRKFKNDIANNDNYWYPALFLGAGYGNRNMMFGIRYDVLYNENRSIYANAWMPFVRVFF